jgi:copper resistance protein B
MKALLAIVASLVPVQAIAQAHDAHQGHGVPAQEVEDPHAGHAMPMAESAASDPHAVHNMSNEDADPHAGHAMPAASVDQSDQGDNLPQSGPPPAAFSGPAHAADTVFPPEIMAQSRAALAPQLGGGTHHLVSIDRLEIQLGEGEDGYVWEANAWFGGDSDKLWIKGEAEGGFGGVLEEVEMQALWSHAIGPYFDVQAGVRYDIRPQPDRAHAVVGIQGLAPYFFELDAAAFLSSEGDITGRIEIEYDQRITQQLILQPRIELGLSAQDIPEIGTGSGLTGIEAGLRLRYEFVPEFAPYVGIEWQRQFGDTAGFARAAGDDPDRIVFMAGIRFWF